MSALAHTITSQSIPGSGATTTVATLELSTGIYLLTIYWTDSNSSGSYVNISTLGAPLTDCNNGPTATNAVPYVAVVSGANPLDIDFTNPSGSATTIAGTILFEPLVVL